MGWSNPVGVGPGQFQYHHPVETHSTFVRVLAEQGFAGLAVWLGIVLATLVLALRNVVRGRETYGIGSAALLGSWCGLVFNSVVVDTLHWRHLWVVAALIWAGAMAESRDRRAERLTAST
jgi:O-antigen ligase